MSPRKQRARKVPADPDRWPPCVRCGQAYRDASPWPEGRVCCYCRRAARQREGTCARCGHHGVVPGLIDGQPACVDCSGVPVDVRCRRCGQEAPMGFAVTCWRCQLQDQLTDLLADPDGVIPAGLAAVRRRSARAAAAPDRVRLDPPQRRRSDHPPPARHRRGAARPCHLRPVARTDHRVPPWAAGRARLPAWPGPLPRRVRELAADQARPDPPILGPVATSTRSPAGICSASSATGPSVNPSPPARSSTPSSPPPSRSTSSTGWPAAAANWRPPPKLMWTPGTPAGPAPATMPHGSSAGHENNTSSGSISRGSSTTTGRS